MKIRVRRGLRYLTDLQDIAAFKSAVQFVCVMFTLQIFLHVLYNFDSLPILYGKNSVARVALEKRCIRIIIFLILHKSICCVLLRAPLR